jgi:hypothetical protein
MLPSPNSNGNPFPNPGLLIATYRSSGLNIAKEGCLSILYVYSLVACRPFVFVVVVIVATANDVVNF